MIEVNEEILIYAFRYTLGRQTCAPYDIALLLIQNKDRISEYSKMIIVNDIEYFLKWNSKDHPADLVELWSNVVKELKQ